MNKRSNHLFVIY